MTTLANILVIDDNSTNLKLARVLLTGEGYNIQTAMNAEEALETLGVFSPRLILMDIQLPGMSGLELTSKLKADPRYKDIIIIALTSYAMKGDEARARASGCDGYVSKPFDPEVLPKIIAGYLRDGIKKETRK